MIIQFVKVNSKAEESLTYSKLRSIVFPKVLGYDGGSSLSPSMFRRFPGFDKRSPVGLTLIEFKLD